MSEFRPIPEYEGRYQMNAEGIVESLPREVRRGQIIQSRKGIVIKPYLHSPHHTEPYVQLNKFGKQKAFMVRKLIALVFPESRPEPVSIPAVKDGKEFRDNIRRMARGLS